jgi:hypothetical protein
MNVESLAGNPLALQGYNVSVATATRACSRFEGGAPSFYAAMR